MAIIHCNLKSNALMTPVHVGLYFPSDCGPEQNSFDPKGVITLLHGYNGSGDDWRDLSSACRYAAENGLILIMPDCGNSFYQDMALGGAYKTFITEEMPMLLDRIFKLPHEREKNFIAGLSMGGYGALYLGLSRPDLYAGCASFSGAVDPDVCFHHMCKAFPETAERSASLWSTIWGKDCTVGPGSNLELLARKTAQLPADQQPRILMTNGLQDIEPFWIAAQNDQLHEKLKTLGIAHYKRLTWNGVHDWNFWDRSLVYAIDYFLQNGYAEKKLNNWSTPAAVEGELN